MGQESSNLGIVYMTMLPTMIWGILIRVQNSFALFLEAPLSILILEEEEQVDHRQEKVRQEKNTFKIYKKMYYIGGPMEGSFGCTVYIS